MVRKIFTLRGKTLEELQRMTLEEFAKILPARQRRSLMRGMTEKQKKFLEKLRKAEKPLRTHCRNMLIIPEMVGKRVMVHKGNEWKPVDITQEMLGHRLGEFVMTRQKVTHSSPGIGATKSSKFIALK